MAGEIVPTAGTAPGFGVAGLMVCPLLKGPCQKSACMLWVELTYAGGTPDEKRVGNCALAWIPILTSENTQEMSRLGGKHANCHCDMCTPVVDTPPADD